MGSKPVRVRIAPSPTGYPHIGTIWQALLNFSFARHFKGKFIVRIEDTDRKRLVVDAEQQLFSSLKWFGLEPDESPIHGGRYGPYRQSERLHLYQQKADELVVQGKAYYCTCSPDRLQSVRLTQQKKGYPPRYDGRCRDLHLKREELKKGDYVIRLKVPRDTKIVVDDLLRGKIVFDSSTIDDQVLIKSDGFPTYHLAVVVDDHLMQISHMVRAEEWLPSVPKNWLLYEYFGWEKPVFVHTPTLRNPDRSKLSKRHGHTAATYYQDKYLKEAIINYLCLLGWSHPKEKELFNLDEFIRLFDFKDLSVSGPVFDEVKLASINGLYIRTMPDLSLSKILSSKFPLPPTWWPKIIPLVKERIKDFSMDSLNIWLGFFTKPPEFSIDQLITDKALAEKQLEKIHALLEKCEWKMGILQKTLLDLVDHTPDWKRSSFFTHLRLAITGSTISPPLIESMEIIGKEECLKRIKSLINKL